MGGGWVDTLPSLKGGASRAKLGSHDLTTRESERVSAVGYGKDQPQMASVRTSSPLPETNPPMSLAGEPGVLFSIIRRATRPGRSWSLTRLRGARAKRDTGLR